MSLSELPWFASRPRACAASRRWPRSCTPPGSPVLARVVALVLGLAELGLELRLGVVPLVEDGGALNRHHASVAQSIVCWLLMVKVYVCTVRHTQLSFSRSVLCWGGRPRRTVAALWPLGCLPCGSCIAIGMLSVSFSLSRSPAARRGVL